MRSKADETFVTVELLSCFLFFNIEELTRQTKLSFAPFIFLSILAL